MMEIFLSKFLPIFIYPLGLAMVFLTAALIFSKKNKTRTTFLILALVVILVGGNRWVSTMVARSLEWQYIPTEPVTDVQAIVLLGGATESADPPRPTVEVNGSADRLIYAAQLYRDGVAPYILLSGGDIAFMDLSASSPAEDMAVLLEQFGVPREAMILEDQSQNTLENAEFARNILIDQMGITRIALVTSAWHMPRSVALFEAQGFEVVPAPTDFGVTEASWQAMLDGDWQAQVLYFLPNVSAMHQLTTSLKEYFGLWYYQLRGYIP
jgi:uncharacterized SAM-binding protein YcdF (DUF218 family)